MKHTIEIEIYGHPLRLVTDKKCFSPHNIDKGTLELLKAVSPQPGQKIMDLGCGYGVVGIACAKIVGPSLVTMVDILPAAIACAQANAAHNLEDDAGLLTIITGDGPDSVEGDGFDLILCNPPYHTDYSVAKAFIEKGYKKLKIGGRMALVLKKPDWYKNKLAGVFGGMQWRESEGYTVLTAEKRPYRPKQTTKAVPRKHLKKRARAEAQKSKAPKGGKGMQDNGNGKKQ